MNDRIGSTQGSFNQFGTIIQSIIRMKILLNDPIAVSVIKGAGAAAVFFVMPRIFIRLIIVKLTRRIPMPIE